MPAWFKDYDGHFRIYEHAREVKKEGDKYVVYDPYGGLLGAHPIDEVQEFSTVEPLPKVTD